MPIFVSKYVNYTVGLRRGYEEIINGHPVVHKPVRAKFENHVFDTESSKAKKLPLDETEIVKTLRKNKYFNQHFHEKGKEPMSLTKLIDLGIRDLREVIDEVNDMTMLKKAIDHEKEKEEPRKMALDLYKGRLEELLGEVL